MSGSNILLDTNIIAALLKGDISVADEIDKSLNVYLSAVVLGELFYGAQYSVKIESNLKNIAKLVSTYEVLDIDTETAKIYGKIKAVLRKNGTQIPENDIWIAATATQYQLNLITRDHHFNHIKNLSIASWQSL